MTYLLKDKKKKKDITVPFVSIICIVVVLGLNAFAPHLFPGIVLTITKPIFGLKNASLGSVEYSQVLKSKSSLISENNNLTSKIATLHQVTVERDFYQEQNRELKQLLGKVDASNTLILSEIMAKPDLSPYDSLILNSGSKDGVKVGSLVMADSQTVLGEIVELHDSISKAILYSASEDKTDVVIGSQAIQAQAVGDGGGNFEIKLPRNSPVKVGDVVTIAGTTNHILGQIVSIQVNASDSFERILFTSPVNIAETRFVFIQK